MNLLEAVRQANRPGPPEDSLVLRLAAFAAVVVSLAACWSQGELSAAVTVGSILLVAVGNAVSYRRRARPLPFLKLVLALAVVVAFVWFISAVSGGVRAGNLASVEGPLAVLFAWIQVTHAFDVPARRDLSFSLAGSATLMAVAAAQAVDADFAFYVMAWAVTMVVGLTAMWASMVGGARVRPGRAAALGVGVLVVAVLVVAVLPAPHANSRLVFPTALAGDQSLAEPSHLVGGSSGTEPQHASSIGGRTHIGGFLGFAGPLDTAIRGDLGNQLIMRVRADRPTFWVAETFDHWNGESWTSSTTRLPDGGLTPLVEGPPFAIPTPADEPGGVGSPDLQTFYLAQGGPNLIFHAANADQVWFPARRLYVQPDGTIVSGTSMGPGSVYTVESTVDVPSPAALAAANPLPGLRVPDAELPGPEYARYTQLPGRGYPRVRALAERITAHVAPGDQYGKIVALEAWLGAHTRYTTDIPPLTAGQDTVEQFLFHTRRGYCEQISTALAVMLRSLGVPAREATGYVPGSYDPLTALYEVQAKDAHAWVQVWFPGYGWQSFDPTAQVPLANPTAAGTLAHDVLAAADRLPAVPTLVVLFGALALGVLLVALRRRPPSWAAAVTGDLLAAARRAGVPVAPHDTLLAVGQRLDAARSRSPDPGDVDPAALAAAAELAVFGGEDVDVGTRRRLRSEATAVRRRARRWRPARRARTAATTAPAAAPAQEVGTGRP